MTPDLDAPGAARPAPRAGTTAGGSLVLDHAGVRRAVTRIAHEIVERNQGAADLVLAGLYRRGVPLAERLAAAIAGFEGVHVPVGRLDTSFYRDDIGLRPVTPPGPTWMPVDVQGRVVVLVDDVLYTGRTVRAALDALGDLGRPRAVQLAVLVDRGHRELPVRADYVGKNLPTRRSDDVAVLLVETDGVAPDAEGVAIRPAGAGDDAAAGGERP